MSIIETDVIKLQRSAAESFRFMLFERNAADRAFRSGLMIEYHRHTGRATSEQLFSAEIYARILELTYPTIPPA